MAALVRHIDVADAVNRHVIRRVELRLHASPIGPYSQAIAAGGFLYISGQLPTDPETGKITGDAPAQAAASLKNLDAILREGGCTRGDVIKTTVFLKNLGDFEGVNRVYAGFFAGTAFPARSTVEVARLPRDALVEIEAVARYCPKTT